MVVTIGFFVWYLYRINPYDQFLNKPMWEWMSVGIPCGGVLEALRLQLFQMMPISGWTKNGSFRSQRSQRSDGKHRSLGGSQQHPKNDF